ncbi:hypothetical protein HAX54_021371, partial [Datura stramonium]|nr:hypothetical protein [Datura stramonium]
MERIGKHVDNSEHQEKKLAASKRKHHTMMERRQETLVFWGSVREHLNFDRVFFGS